MLLYNLILNRIELTKQLVAMTKWLSSASRPAVSFTNNCSINEGLSSKRGGKTI